MKTLNAHSGQENKKKVAFISFKNTKRLQWDTYRRYGLYNA